MKHRAAKRSRRKTLRRFLASIQQGRRQQPAACTQSKVLHYSVRSAGNTIENVFAKDLLAFINSKQQGRRASSTVPGFLQWQTTFQGARRGKMEAQTRFPFRLRKSFKKAKSNAGHPSLFPLELFKGAAPRKIRCRPTARREIVRQTDRGITKKKQSVLI